MSYCIYLRKSRKDMEAESHGDGETLARHEHTLLSLARQKQLIIGNIYREIVSGETIAARPVMQRLLREVEQGLWDGVLVMEVERLARGDTIDQGVVQRAFQYTNTLIVTPMKTYDPANEFDEEYFEFGLFMSRREYKTIKRRMQAGRYAAAQEGKWPFNMAPYGFRRVKLEQEKGWTLEFDEQEAPVVRLIFRMFTGPSRIGITYIKRNLNMQGIRPRKSQKWTDSSIRDILRNEAYDKKVAIGQRKASIQIVDGSPIKTRPRSTDYISVEARHPRMIDHDMFLEAQSYLGLGSPKSPESYGIKNPLAGIIVCSECGLKMYRRPASKIRGKLSYDVLMCKTDGCPTVGSKLDLVEEKLIECLSDWVSGYQLNTPIHQSLIPEKQQILKRIQTEHQKLLQQREKLYDLLETGVYTTEIFLERSNKLQKQISQFEEHIHQLEDDLKTEQLREENINHFLPTCRDLLSSYWTLSNQERNKALKLILESVEYKKLTRNKRGEKEVATFELSLKPRIPRN